MNPDTHMFESLDSPEAVERAHLRGWKVFKIGEIVTIKDTKFTVKDISPTKLVLRPHGVDSENLANDLVASFESKISELSEPKPFVQGIGWAVKEMQNGAKVRRAGWNGKGMWLQLQVPDEHSKMTHPYVYIEYPSGHPAYPNGSRVPWLASQTDLLATDWEIA